METLPEFTVSQNVYKKGFTQVFWLFFISFFLVIFVAGIAIMILWEIMRMDWPVSYQGYLILSLIIIAVLIDIGYMYSLNVRNKYSDVNFYADHISIYSSDYLLLLRPKLYEETVVNNSDITSITKVSEDTTEFCTADMRYVLHHKNDAIDIARFIELTKNCSAVFSYLNIKGETLEYFPQVEGGKFLNNPDSATKWLVGVKNVNSWDIYRNGSNTPAACIRFSSSPYNWDFDLYDYATQKVLMKVDLYSAYTYITRSTIYEPALAFYIPIKDNRNTVISFAKAITALNVKEAGEIKSGMDKITYDLGGFGGKTGVVTVNDNWVINVTRQDRLITSISTFESSTQEISFNTIAIIAMTITGAENMFSSMNDHD